MIEKDLSNYYEILGKNNPLQSDYLSLMNIYGIQFCPLEYSKSDYAKFNYKKHSEAGMEFSTEVSFYGEPFGVFENWRPMTQRKFNKEHEIHFYEYENLNCFRLTPYLGKLFGENYNNDYDYDGIKNLIRYKAIKFINNFYKSIEKYKPIFMTLSNENLYDDESIWLTYDSEMRKIDELNLKGNESFEEIMQLLCTIYMSFFSKFDDQLKKGCLEEFDKNMKFIIGFDNDKFINHNKLRAFVLNNSNKFDENKLKSIGEAKYNLSNSIILSLDDIYLEEKEFISNLDLLAKENKINTSDFCQLNSKNKKVSNMNLMSIQFTNIKQITYFEKEYLYEEILYNNVVVGIFTKNIGSDYHFYFVSPPKDICPKNIKYKDYEKEFIDKNKKILVDIILKYMNNIKKSKKFDIYFEINDELYFPNKNDDEIKIIESFCLFYYYCLEEEDKLFNKDIPCYVHKIVKKINKKGKIDSDISYICEIPEGIAKKPNDEIINYLTKEYCPIEICIKVDYIIIKKDDYIINKL